MAFEADYNGNPINNGGNDNGNQQQGKWFDLAGRAYSKYTGTLTWEPTFDGRAPGILLRIAKATNPGQDNTPCDWKNCKYWSLEARECYEVVNWARSAKANNNQIDQLKLFHKNNGMNKTLSISPAQKSNGYSVFIGEGEGNFANTTVGGAEWAQFIGCCEFVYKNGIGIRAMLGEMAKIVGGTSEFNQVAKRGKFGNNAGNNNGYSRSYNNNNSNGGNGYSQRNYQGQSPRPRNVPAPTPTNNNVSYSESYESSELDI